MKFGQGTNVDDPYVDLEGQRSRSQGKKNIIFGVISVLQVLCLW